MTSPTDYLENGEQDEGESIVVEGDGADLDLLAGRRIALVGRFGGMN